MLPEYSSRWPARPTKTFVTSRPLVPVSSRSTWASVSRVTFGYFNAGRTAMTSASALA